MGITIDALMPYFIKNDYGSGDNICQDYTIADDFELYVDGKFFNRFERNTDTSYELISDYEQECITLTNAHEVIANSELLQVSRVVILQND